MKKLAAFLTALCLSLSLTACARPSDTVELKEGVSFALTDALRITNNTTNTVYYYFLASVDNKSSEGYSMDSLSYHITDEGNSDIHEIDKDKVTITRTVQPDQNTFVYGYAGYPNNNQKNMGLYFPKEKQFLPFNSVKVREISDKNVHYSDSNKYVLYDDKYFTIEVDGSDCKYEYREGNSYISGLTITYTNKTEDRLVVPYIKPDAVMTGLKLSEIKDKGNLAAMSLEELKQVDLSSDGMAPRTKQYYGESFGYECFYLGARQSVPCSVTFTFGDVIPDFANYNPKGVEVDLNCPALGYSQQIYINY